MFSKLGYALDFAKNEARNMVLQVLGAAPGTPVQGQSYYDSVLTAPRWYDGAAWTNKATDSLLLNGQNAAFYLARANHTGTQLAASISDLATTVQGYRLDQFGIPNADINLNSHKLINVTDPTNPQDAATKNYVDIGVSNAAAGIDSKPSVRVAATANIALTGTQTIDGVAVIAGDRVLAPAQTTASQNGVYVVAAGAWARAADADQTGEITPGATWFVEEGTANGASTWRTANTGVITLGTTAISITKLTTSTSYTAGNGLQLTGSAFSVLLPANSGLLSAGTGLSIDPAVVVRKFSALVGNGAATAIAVTHNLNTLDVHVSVRDAATNEFVGIKVVATDVNNVTVTFGVAPAANAYRVTVFG